MAVLSTESSDGVRARRACVTAVLLLCAAQAPTAQQAPFVERVEVARVLVDVRVFDGGGNPVPGLEASDFTVRIGGWPVRVESAEWVGGPATGGSGRPGLGPPPADRPILSGGREPGVRPPAGRLVVFLVQRDLEARRIVGLMRIARLVDTLLQPLTREDRVAVLSFDSRLRIWTDFTGDLERIRSLLGRDVINGRPAAITEAAGVSLVARLPPSRAERIYGIEHAMRHIAEALEPLHGAKSLVLLGYGFGRFDARADTVLLMDGYDQASAALQRARVSVFTLNVTQADHNSLQAGLQTVASETGGMYASTFHFPERAVASVSAALAGYYVLFVEPPGLRAGEHRIDVRLTGRRGRVLARSTYTSSATPP